MALPIQSLVDVEFKSNLRTDPKIIPRGTPHLKTLFQGRLTVINVHVTDLSSIT